MQSNEMDFSLTPSLLETPSLMTPNILQNNNNSNNLNPFKSYGVHEMNLTSEQETLPDSNPSSIPTTVTNSVTTSEPSSSSSGDVKLSRIEDDLKKSLFTRLPTPSPFATIATANGTGISSMSFQTATENTTVPEVPSTADVVLALESLTNTSVAKYLPKPMSTENSEREINALINENNRDSSPIMNSGHLVSPKKIFLIRSQSITDATSPAAVVAATNSTTHSQKTTHGDIGTMNLSSELDEENSMDDSVSNHFSRNPDEISVSNHSNGIQHPTFSTTMTNGTDGVYSVQQHSIVKQQPTAAAHVINNKRAFQQTIPNPMTKSTQIIIPTGAVTNEVTSTDQSLTPKRQKTNSNIMNFRPTSSSTTTTTIPTAAHSPNAGGGSDDQRKKQIRDSNREAARRCRERRRQYIEQLEGNLEQSKLQIKQLTEKLTRVERENLQLRALLSETKLLHPTARLATSDNSGDYVDVVTANEIGLSIESTHQTDGSLLQRNFINRNNL